MQDKYKVLFILLLPSFPVPLLNLFLHKNSKASGNWNQGFPELWKITFGRASRNLHQHGGMLFQPSHLPHNHFSSTSQLSH